MTSKENAPVFETEAPSATAQPDSTTPAVERETRAPYNPLTWRTPEVPDQAQQTPTEKTPDPLLGWHQLGDPARKAQKPFRGKAKRNARREAVAAKRHQTGGATLDAMCLAAGIFWLATEHRLQATVAVRKIGAKLRRCLAQLIKHRADVAHHVLVLFFAQFRDLAATHGQAGVVLLWAWEALL